MNPALPCLPHASLPRSTTGLCLWFIIFLGRLPAWHRLGLHVVKGLGRGGAGIYGCEGMLEMWGVGEVIKEWGGGVAVKSRLHVGASRSLIRPERAGELGP